MLLSLASDDELTQIIDFSTLVSSRLPPVDVDAGDGSTTINVNRGTVPINTNFGIGGVNVTLNVNNAGAEVELAGAQTLKQANVGEGATLDLLADSAMYQFGSLNLAGDDEPTGEVDINGNAVLFDEVVAFGPDGDPLQTVAAQIANAYHAGAWDQPGITSSLADASNFGIGFARASDIFTSFPAMFMGVEVGPNDILIRHTRYGDANLDGTTNLQDFNRLAGNFGASTILWSSGNFNYDPVVNLLDFNRLAGNFGQSAAPDLDEPEDLLDMS
jgi:hypothetical protein